MWNREGTVAVRNECSRPLALMFMDAEATQRPDGRPGARHALHRRPRCGASRPASCSPPARWASGRACALRPRTGRRSRSASTTASRAGRIRRAVSNQTSSFRLSSSATTAGRSCPAVTAIPSPPTSGPPPFLPRHLAQPSPRIAEHSSPMARSGNSRRLRPSSLFAVDVCLCWPGWRLDACLSSGMFGGDAGMAMKTMLRHGHVKWVCTKPAPSLVFGGKKMRKLAVFVAAASLVSGFVAPATAETANLLGAPAVPRNVRPYNRLNSRRPSRRSSFFAASRRMPPNLPGSYG